jgi:hypothetical protein
MTEWSDQVRRQVRLVVDQIAELRLRDTGRGFERSLDVYYEMLERLFDQDLRLAQVRDNSDLLLRVEGEAFDHDPRLQLVTSVFDNVTHQVTDLTKAILGTGAEGKITPKAVDLGLSGIARGSLYFGLKAVETETKNGGALLGKADSLYSSTRWALKIIDDVAHTIEMDPDHVSMEEVSEVVHDPRVRDAALVAVQRLAPTGRRGIESMSVSGSNSNSKPAELNASHRRSIRSSLQKPVIKGEEIEFSGQVREIDLDSRRFDLRGIADEQIRDVRCAYRNVDGVSPKKLLGATVRVRGLVERAADEVPRLMSVTTLEITRAAPDDL